MAAAVWMASSVASDRSAHAVDPDALITLGRQLFSDPRLSKDGQMSCSTCHRPDRAWTDGQQRARGAGGKVLRRNTPTLLHVNALQFFFWDGRSTSLEQQAVEPIRHTDEMAQSLELLEKELSRIPGYVAQFQEVFGTSVTLEGVVQAIAAYERTLVSRNAPFDLYLSGSNHAITESAKRGMELFQDRARCAFCHKGFNFTDSEFHNIGVPTPPGFPQDDGRYEITRRPQDRGAFKTPTLRNVTQTGPYMHNGVFTTLEEVVEFYNAGGGRNPNLDLLIKPLRLAVREKADLVEFLKSLTGTVPDTTPPILP
jgi:cytochrome c peroxidase